jgi:GAF domain-containing protein
MSPDSAPPPDDRLDPATPGEPLVPLLRAEQGLADPDALSTWHAVLSNAISVELPHDLLGLWLYPIHGGSVLIGPEALAQDDLAVPVPSPQVAPAQVRMLEDIVRDAGYPSVTCVPVRSGGRDVGLMLAADLRAHRYGEREQMTLELVAQRIAPLLGRMARQWHGGRTGTPQIMRAAALVDALSALGAHAGTPQLYVSELSRSLQPLLPHDHLELLLADTGGARAYRLGEHAGGPLWIDPSLVVGPELDLGGLFEGGDVLVLPDTYQEVRWPRGYFTVEEPAGAELRSIAGVRIRTARGLTAYLLAGSVGADLFDEDDAALLARVAGLIAPQVAVLADANGSTGKSTLGHPSAGAVARPPSIHDAVELLATGTEFAETTRRVADLAARLIPFDAIRFAIRLSEGDRVVLLEPGERRPLPDLPLVPVAGTTLAAVIQGELPNSFALVEGEARLVVPLRVAGRIHGALVLTARHPAVLREVHLEPAQQLADVIASHLELLRRTALLPPPYLPGWKKVR